ncbi:MAG TPA: ABC transporter permease [Myxococcales bacterium]|nr:ABC transporter permease [Myxococcales bacterium]
MGISTFTFFIALSQGVRDRVLNRIFPIDQLEVESVGGVSSGGDSSNPESQLDAVLGSGPRVLDRATVDQLATIQGVSHAFPKMRARFPAKVETGVLDRRMAGEGFLEGLQTNESVSEQMRMVESQCSSMDEDICHRREVSCKRDSECPHEGMECRVEDGSSEGRCMPRQYWRSFRDRHSRPKCSTRSDCNNNQRCTYDRWIILKVSRKEQIAPIQDALARVTHIALDVDFYVPIAVAGAVTNDDVENADRTQGEIWSIGAQVTEQATLDIASKRVVLHQFATLDLALNHIKALPHTLSEGQCAGRSCTLDKAERSIGSWKYFQLYENHRSDCSMGMYCAARNVLSRRGRCEPYMPVTLNPMMVDFYNTNVVSQLGTQPLPNPCLVLGLKGYFRLGFSFLRSSRAMVWQRVRWSEIVGFSDKAMHLGGTVPLPYVKRFNRYFLGSSAIKQFDSVLLQVTRNEKVAEVIEGVESQGFDLSRSSKFARKAGEMLMIITLAFLMISLIIIVISAMNISHTFLMVVYERQREIGVMRAIGATQWDIRKIILVESALIGLVAGVIGNLLSFGVSRIVNLTADSLRGRFPLIPDDFFIYSSDLILGSIVFALIFCLVGAWVPANRAAKLDPAVVLTSA